MYQRNVFAVAGLGAAVVYFVALTFMTFELPFFELFKDIGKSHLQTLILFSILAFLSLYLLRLNNKLKRELDKNAYTESQMQKLSSAVTHSGALVAIITAKGTIEYVNEQFCKMTGYVRAEVLGQPISLLSPKNIRGESTFQNLDPTELGENWEGDILCARKHGEHFWSATTVAAVYDVKRRLTHFVISGIDISDLKEANRKMEHLALFDSLTGLANRRLFIDRLNQTLLNTKRQTQCAALMFLDLDHFKRINDTLGHQAGDDLLLTVARRLQAAVRVNDTVARLGGDEFTILLADIGHSDNAAAIARNILSSLKQPILLEKNEVIVSTSIGITLAPSDGSSSDQLMKNADLALYKAKENGRDTYHFFTEELNTDAQHKLDIENELRIALVQEDFSLQYQPQVNLRTGKIESVEALIRWNHPTRGWISPVDFIPVAESTGLIVPIGEWVIRNACEEIKKLHRFTGSDIRVAVNLSARQFSDPGLEQTIINVLDEVDMNAECLEIEVTESMLMDNIDVAINQLDRIKATGASITIDDFGSGYSSLSYLKKLPVDILKVDREFVRDIPDDLNAMEITSAIIAMAHNLNLKVIAEGVETIDQRDFLQINRCDYAQGYFYSKPLALASMINYFGTSNRITA